ncbi:MAG: amino acid transporter rane protein 1, family, partial [Nocardioidaceae bacterium]|nr:amino acid transporter rane protein 1, family [Nocardioidaceae bacterium]
MDIIREYFPILQHGFLITVLLTVLGILGTVVVAFAVGLARLSSHAVLRAPAYVFVEVFRGTSLVVQLFWIFYALPFAGFAFDPIPAAVLVLALNEGAYGAEVVRGTTATRPTGQTEACIALGLSPTQRLWRVLIPQSIPRMIPAFGNIMVDLLKATSLVSLV